MIQSGLLEKLFCVSYGAINLDSKSTFCKVEKGQTVACKKKLELLQL